MGMGIVSETEFDLERSKLSKREESSSNPTINHPIVESDNRNNAIIIDVNRGRGKGNVAVPDSLRRVIGDTAATDGRQAALEIANQFGISPSSTSAYGVGATSTATYDNKPNAPVIDNARLRVQSKARHKLMSALRHITDDKLGEAKVRDLAGIAKDMSVIIKNMEPENSETNTKDKGPQFIFYAPQFRDERNFETIYAKE